MTECVAEGSSLLELKLRAAVAPLAGTSVGLTLSGDARLSTRDGGAAGLKKELR